MKRNILGLFAVLTAIVGCGYFYSAQEATLPTETPVVNRYMDKENPPKGIRKSLEHVMKMWTNMGELEYSDELYSNMIKSADALKQANNPFLGTLCLQ